MLFVGDRSVDRALAGLGVDVQVLPEALDLGPRLAAAIRNHRPGRPPAAGWDASAYSRDNEAGQLARFLRSCAARRAGRRATPGAAAGS